ncbi:sarcosine oxidase, gamma subunit [Sedimentitalea todarodis]|uniref:Sarcosine oxidase, gamma subunit n=2 Tax=Sedimentitalea todarodis TaxID=1631240 RepID=A0ABU3VHV6_9RHOB|nr:sarcosine oxidase, gamma subunit [Sedimentitalea todarodis]
MHDMTALTALGGASAQVDTFDGLEISECPDWALASLAGRLGQEAGSAKAAQAYLGKPLPDVGTCTAATPFYVFWTGPDQWMIEAPHDSHEDLAAQVKAAVLDTSSVTEQTDGWVRFDLAGPRCHDVLELLCNADTRSMAAHTTTRTRMEHLGCFLICRAVGHFSVLGPRSSAGSLHHALITAARSAI